MTGRVALGLALASGLLAAACAGVPGRTPVPATASAHPAWLVGDWTDAPEACGGTDVFTRFAAGGGYLSSPEGSPGRWALAGSELVVSVDGETHRLTAEPLGTGRVRLRHQDGAAFVLVRCPSDG